MSGKRNKTGRVDANTDDAQPNETSRDDGGQAIHEQTTHQPLPAVVARLQQSDPEEQFWNVRTYVQYLVNNMDAAENAEQALLTFVEAREELAVEEDVDDDDIARALWVLLVIQEAMQRHTATTFTPQ